MSFSPKKIDNFLGKSKLNFWTKNEDFEQCVEVGFWAFITFFPFILQLWEQSQIDNSRLRDELSKTRDELSAAKKKIETVVHVSFIILFGSIIC